MSGLLHDTDCSRWSGLFGVTPQMTLGTISHNPGIADSKSPTPWGGKMKCSEWHPEQDRDFWIPAPGPQSPALLETRLAGIPSDSPRFALCTEWPCAELSKSSLKLHQHWLLTFPLQEDPFHSVPTLTPAYLTAPSHSLYSSWKDEIVLEKIQYYQGEIPLLPVKQHLSCLLLLPCPVLPHPFSCQWAIPWLRELVQLQNDFWGFFPRWISHWISCLSWPAEHQGGRRGCRAQRHRSVTSLSPGSRADTPSRCSCQKTSALSCNSTGTIHELNTRQQSHCCTAQSLPWGITWILGAERTGEPALSPHLFVFPFAFGGALVRGLLLGLPRVFLRSALLLRLGSICILVRLPWYPG